MFGAREEGRLSLSCALHSLSTNCLLCWHVSASHYPPLRLGRLVISHTHCRPPTHFPFLLLLDRRCCLVNDCSYIAPPLQAAHCGHWAPRPECPRDVSWLPQTLPLHHCSHGGGGGGGRGCYYTLPGCLPMTTGSGLSYNYRLLGVHIAINSNTVGGTVTS